ncbi:PP2C family protein-serine/threonine phosphatase [Sporolituus thermophilus]|uniref:Stage II sporulation protein E (SpoIIE) n=1 Tax=Sporolituus thermophilus DSM 23256 TaxID=1123285 RepID=A0A1G7IEN8_9FIRM|nr:PP2C family protein-serine/threonine phosphatase [Sporolituus thermophilus]SDF11197.1 Stage II sporulation protein E (SpoIIE) [Sporolituus thermophilus DSM 23256]
MEVKIGIAKTNKYAVSECGDSVEIAERPRGGISVILADGQGSGRAAKNTSSLVVNKAASLIAEGARDGAVARAVHDYLYAMKDGKVSSTLTILSSDLDTQTILFSRNSNCPVLVKSLYGIEVFDQEVSPIGVHKRMKPLMHEMPLEVGMILVSYSDGIQAAGRKRGRVFDFNFLLRLLEKNEPRDVVFIAESILEYALELDDNRAGDDMTVIVMGICEAESHHKIRRISVSFPC